VGEALLYAGAIVVALWGVAHLIPTGSMVAGFGTITLDNRRVLTRQRDRAHSRRQRTGLKKCVLADA
jgi:hypothetical protein